MAAVLSPGSPAADPSYMRDGLRNLIELDEYRVDAGAVATVMLTRALALRAARSADGGSQVLVASDEIEVRRLRAPEGQSFPLRNTA